MLGPSIEHLLALHRKGSHPTMFSPPPLPIFYLRAGVLDATLATTTTIATTTAAMTSVAHLGSFPLPLPSRHRLYVEPIFLFIYSTPWNIPRLREVKGAGMEFSLGEQPITEEGWLGTMNCWDWSHLTATRTRRWDCVEAVCANASTRNLRIGKLAFKNPYYYTHPSPSSLHVALDYIAMAPIKTSISTAKVAPTSSVSENILFSSCPSTAVLESTLSNSSLPRPLIDTLLVLTILYIIIPHIYNWRYPVQSAQGLRRLTLSVERSIQKVGGKHGLNLKERLWEINDRITALKARIEPPRSSLFAWIAFKWDMLKEVDVCYVALKKLECEAQAKPQCVGEGNLEGEQCAGTSAVEAG
uniref:Uncharacterized protein n=1 Tax=Moniliophthora roreri TaxID=221103 RepID=A0A0W0F9E0_MONRR